MNFFHNNFTTHVLIALSTSMLCTAVLTSQRPVSCKETAQDLPTITNIVQGPLTVERQALLHQILAADKRGVGIAAYLSEFSKIEEAVKNGQEVGQLKQKIKSLQFSLAEQLKRSEVLKTQRPVPSSQSLSSTSSPGNSQDEGGAKSLLDKLREKLGTDIHIPDNIKEKIMQSKKGKAILKKLEEK